jgi:hypothetical protein
VNDPIEDDLESQFGLLGALLRKFHVYLKESVVLLVSSIREEGLKSIPKRCLNVDYYDNLLSLNGKKMLKKK